MGEMANGNEILKMAATVTNMFQLLTIDLKRVYDLHTHSKIQVYVTCKLKTTKEHKGCKST